MNRSTESHVHIQNILGERFKVPNSPLAIRMMLDYVKETGIPAKVVL